MNEHFTYVKRDFYARNSQPALPVSSHTHTHFIRIRGLGMHVYMGDIKAIVDAKHFATECA